MEQFDFSKGESMLRCAITIHMLDKISKVKLQSRISCSIMLSSDYVVNHNVFILKRCVYCYLMQ